MIIFNKVWGSGLSPGVLKRKSKRRKKKEGIEEGKEEEMVLLYALGKGNRILT